MTTRFDTARDYILDGLWMAGKNGLTGKEVNQLKEVIDGMLEDFELNEDVEKDDEVLAVDHAMAMGEEGI